MAAEDGGSGRQGENGGELGGLYTAKGGAKDGAKGSAVLLPTGP